MPPDRNVTIGRARFDGVIFDLDGVVTDSASIHALAWQAMFDRFLSRQASRREPLRPFDTDGDYRRYVDGKARLDGIRSFLGSRGLVLPEGTPADPAGTDTLYGLGAEKNGIFLELVRERGVTVYPSTVDFVQRLKTHGFATAVVSSSRNCQLILEKAGLSELFDVRVDGVDAAALDIPGKPAPDIFLAAAQRLGIVPARTVVLEDALSGVQAGRAGRFGLVIGVDRKNNGVELLGHGADVTVTDADEIAVEGEGGVAIPPSALERLDEIRQRCAGKALAIFLDYDGTLTPIVETPDRAVLPEEMRRVITTLAHHCTVAVISGRDLQDVRRLVGIDTIVYAGSHGFDIAGPGGSPLQSQVGAEFLPDLEKAGRDMAEAVAGIAGALVERKKFAIAVHYRRVPEELVDQVQRVFDGVAARYPRLRKTGGKKVMELRPDIDWHKGKALLSLLTALYMGRPDVVPLYIGDDLTDEDAFNAIAANGIGIVVLDQPRATAAAYSLANTEEVGHFLREVTPLCSGAGHG